MKIGTWNVEYAGEAKNLLRLQRLVQADADIWVLTETHDRLDLAPGYTSVSTPASRKGGGRWVTIWSRFPVLEVVPVCISRELAKDARVIDAWEGVVDGVRLSDHSGVVVEISHRGGRITRRASTSS